MNAKKRMLMLIVSMMLLLFVFAASVGAQSNGNKTENSEPVKGAGEGSSILPAREGAAKAPQYTSGDSDFFITSNGVTRHNEWEYGLPYNPVTGDDTQSAGNTEPNSAIGCAAASGGCWGIDMDSTSDDEGDHRLRTFNYITMGGDGGLYVRFEHYIDLDDDFINSEGGTLNFGVDCDNDDTFTDVQVWDDSDNTGWVSTGWINLETNAGGVAEGCNDGDPVAFSWVFMPDNDGDERLGWYIDNVQMEDSSGDTRWLDADFEITTPGACGNVILNEVGYNFNPIKADWGMGEAIELYVTTDLAPGETYFLWDLGDANNGPIGGEGVEQLREARYSYSFTVHDFGDGPSGGIEAGSYILIYNHLAGLAPLGSSDNVGGWITTSSPYVFVAGSPDSDDDLEDGGDEIALYAGNNPRGTQCDVVQWKDDSGNDQYEDTVPVTRAFTWDTTCSFQSNSDVLFTGDTNAPENALGYQSVSLDTDGSLQAGTPTNDSSCDWAVSGHSSESHGTHDAASNIGATFGYHSLGEINNPTEATGAISCNTATETFTDGIPAEWSIFDWQTIASDDSDGFTWSVWDGAHSTSDCPVDTACTESEHYPNLDVFEVELQTNNFDIASNVSSAVSTSEICVDIVYVATSDGGEFDVEIFSVTDNSYYSLDSFTTDFTGTKCYDIPSIGGGAILGDTVFIDFYHTNLPASTTNTNGYASVDNVSVTCFTPLAVEMSSAEVVSNDMSTVPIIIGILLVLLTMVSASMLLKRKR